MTRVKADTEKPTALILWGTGVLEPGSSRKQQRVGFVSREKPKK
jgi:hypothetical protein